MPVLVEGRRLDPARPLRELLRAFPELEEQAKQFRSQPAQAVGPKGLLYVQQREFAATTSKDGSVSILGSDDATTCHFVVLRHTGSGAICLTHCDGSDTETEVLLIVNAVKVLSLSTDCGRSVFLKNIIIILLNNLVKSWGMISIYDSKKEQLCIGPYYWMPFPHVDFWLEQSNQSILQNLSTSPLAEPPHFVSHIRATLLYLREHPFPDKTLFPTQKPRLYEKNAEGLWERVSGQI
ncbi:protein N-terminal asparagine amidohydrolase [Pantherophis guttatus]|uniref:Protein N-terminal asparagine amidohydrolase n=1 Tax=Pantherophis guttatus TaxID=94885 RepID=A0A6P9CNM4_PANGU|nr:protein N-terminal asparagine amidohydrolase [Pantherophis guttatus]